MNIMKKNIAMQNELVQVKGRVKAITIKKEDFYNFLKLTKLRVLDKTYDALMPPIDNPKKNAIDLNGLEIIIQNYLASLIYNSGSTSSPIQAQIILSTSSGTSATLQYSDGITTNTRGVTVLPQIFGASGNVTFQFYFIGFDTTGSSYSATQAELYASASVASSYSVYGTPNPKTYYTSLERIAYTNISITKSSTEYLFLVWLIEFENVPSYASFAVPMFQNVLGLRTDAFVTASTPAPTTVTVYFYNGSCAFTCGGNCPSGGLNSFSIFPQNNALILQLPLQAPLQGGISNPEILICTTTNFSIYSSINLNYKVVATISGSVSTTVASPVSGATIYLAIVTISITYSVS